MSPASGERGEPEAPYRPGPSLVTGAAGFIGTRLVQALRASDERVRALVRPGHDVRALEASGAEIVRGDASDPDSVAKAAKGCRVIFHLAAARGDRKLGYRAYRARNLELTEAVALGAHAAGAERIVVTSTATLTGSSGPAIQTEATPARPNSGYRSSRLHAERLLDGLADRYGLDVVTARVSQMVMGAGTRSWIRHVRAVRDGAIRVLPPDGTIHSCDVDDLVHGLLRCAAVPGISGERFTLAAAEPIGTVELLSIVARRLGVAFTPRLVPAAPFRAYVALGNVAFRVGRVSLPYHFTAELYSGRFALDIGKARRLLAYAPRVALSESIVRTVDWLRAHDLA